MAPALEVYPSDALVWLELGGMYDAPAIITDLMIDGNMEAPDTSAYIVPAFGVLTKDTTNPHSGTRCLRIAYQGNAIAYARQSNKFTVGNQYILTGWMRSDGTRVPRITDGTAEIWIGQASTTWQYVNINFVATNTSVNFFSSNMAPGGWIEVDDVKIVPVSSTIGNILNDWNMEAADTAAWTFWNAVLSKQAGAYAGNRCLRIASDGNAGHPAGYATQSPLVSGHKYRVTGMARGDGSATPLVIDNLVTIWTGTTSASWQPFDITFTATGTFFNIGSQNFTPGHYVEFDQIAVTEILKVVDNLAEMGGAPAYVTAGDGFTTSAIPTQMSNKRGVIFDSPSKYLDTGLKYPTLRTQQFSVFALVSLYGQSFWGMCGTRSGDASAIGFDVQLGTGATTALTTLFSYDAATNKYLQLQSILPASLIATAGGSALMSIAVTHNGSGVAAGVQHYANGFPIAKTTLLDALGTNDFASPYTFKIGRRVASGGASVRQDLLAFMLLPKVMSPIQVQNLHRYVMSRINI